MNRKNVIRTLTVIAVVLLLGWSFFYFSDNTSGYKPVDTSVAMAQIKEHYFTTHDMINPSRIIPIGPDLDFLAPHGRDA